VDECKPLVHGRAPQIAANFAARSTGELSQTTQAGPGQSIPGCLLLVYYDKVRHTTLTLS